MSQRQKQVYGGLAISLVAAVTLTVVVTMNRPAAPAPLSPSRFKSPSAVVPAARESAAISGRPSCEDMNGKVDRDECLFFKTLPAESLKAAQAMNELYTKQPPELHYWIRDGVSKSQRRGLDLRDGPCGPYVMAPSRLTAPPDNRLEADQIVEVDSTGAVLRKWPVPEGWLLGIIGNEVLVAHDFGGREDLALAVTTDGRYRVMPVDNYLHAEIRKASECPRYDGFGNSAYSTCSIIQQPDATVRYLIWQGPCT